MGWMQHGDSKGGKIRDMKEVALAVNSIMGGSGNLENVFSMSSDLLTRRRSSMHEANAEMVMVCNVEQKKGVKLSPDYVQVLTPDQAAAAIPRHLRDPELAKALEDLDWDSPWDPPDFDAVAEMARWSSVAALAKSYDGIDSFDDDNSLGSLGEVGVGGEAPWAPPITDDLGSEDFLDQMLHQGRGRQGTGTAAAAPVAPPSTEIGGGRGGGSTAMQSNEAMLSLLAAATRGALGGNRG